MINKCTKFIQSLVFSQACISCNASTDTEIAICSDCASKLPENTQSCTQCAQPLKSSETLICPDCQQKPPVFQTAFIPFQYRQPIDQLIWKFKFRNDLVSGKLLADLFVKRLLESEKVFPEILIPVPLHPSRMRNRGYNQALWLAKQIQKSTGIPVNSQLVTRTLKTPPQHELDMHKRRTVLQHAFRVNHELHHQHIAIVDDVLTTGSTINEIARRIDSSGRIKIEAWALARTTK